MKRQAFSLVSLLSLLLVAGSAIAQTVHVRANIPFNFAVGSKTLPAGTYDVGTIDGTSKCSYCRPETAARARWWEATRHKISSLRTKPSWSSISTEAGISCPRSG